jgi:hypothetical protein
MKHRYNVVEGYAMPFIKRQFAWLLPVFIHLLLGLPVQAQEKKPIKGLVENEQGEALEGVTIDMKSETAADIRRSTVTGKKGVFTFENPGAKGTYVFTFSHVGYVTQVVRKESKKKNNHQPCPCG